ncbi:MAG: tryptophanase [Bradymonadales bacterium]|nr:MAG: tryptophanase [Bradymonadales bacterium]
MEFQSKVIIEPFQVKSVQSLDFTTRDERSAALKEARYNLFRLPAQKVLIDLLTDSGTSAMSSEQWAALQRGDESYAGAKSFQKFQSKVQELTGYEYIIPTHQGRAAERLLFSVLSERRGSTAEPQWVPNNSHFDTTRANIEAVGFRAIDFVSPAAQKVQEAIPFKGNMDVEALKKFLESTPRSQIPVGMLTLTNNSCGGQPVSLENIREVSRLYRHYGIPFILDACRFAENVAFICRDEEKGRMPAEVAREIFSLADGCSFSAKKDALVNIGGFLALKSSDWVEDLHSQLILTEGFPTYGGLAGRDLEAMTQGLDEVLEPAYLEYRLASLEYLGKFCEQKGIPYLKPVGGHALYLDAASFYPHLKWSDYPGQSLALSLYLEGGLRSCEIGSLMFGRQFDGTEKAHGVELVRLAIPRRVYTQSHMDYCLELIEFVFHQRKAAKAVRILKEPKRLRHFTAEFSW